MTSKLEIKSDGLSGRNARPMLNGVPIEHCKRIELVVDAGEVTTAKIYVLADALDIEVIAEPYFTASPVPSNKKPSIIQKIKEYIW